MAGAWHPGMRSLSVLAPARWAEARGGQTRSVGSGRDLTTLPTLVGADPSHPVGHPLAAEWPDARKSIAPLALGVPRPYLPRDSLDGLAQPDRRLALRVELQVLMQGVLVGGEGTLRVLEPLPRPAELHAREH